MKERNWGVIISVLLIIVGIVCSIAGAVGSSAVSAKLSKFPTVENEAQLREAIAGEPQTVLVYNAPLTGERCVDPMGILSGDYVVLEYRLYRYGGSAHDKGWKLKQTETRCGENLMIYGDIPLKGEGYVPYPVKIDLRKEIDPALVRHVDRDFYNTYYPNGSERTDGNEKYNVYGIAQGAETAFLAEAGNGQLALKPLKKGGIAVIDGNNDAESLMHEFSEGSNMSVAIGVPLVLIGMLIGIFSVVSMIAEKAKRRMQIGE